MNNKHKLQIVVLLLILGLLGGLLGVLFSASRLGVRTASIPLKVSLADDLAVKQAAGSYLQAWQDAAPDKMYVFLSEIDRARVSAEEYRRHFEAFPVSPLHFQLGAVKLLAADRAAIQARILWPELAGEGALDKDEQLVLVKENSVWRVREDESLN